MNRVILWAGSVRSPRPATACRKCGHEQGSLVRYIYTNGTVALRWECTSCKDYGTFQDIPHSFLDGFGVALEDVPVCFDASSNGEPCVVCALRSTEFHHWAPTSIFPPEWSHIGGYLCRAHHIEWHNTMREHGLRYPHELAAEAV